MVKKFPNYLLLVFFTWRILLLIVSLLAIKFIPLGVTDRFLGGGPKNFFLLPQIFSWANFDGEHYLAISVFGYKGLEQAFFPIYPLTIFLLTKLLFFLNDSILLLSTISGLIISNLSFLAAIIVLYKLIRLDFSHQIASWTVLSLVFFPASFYFGAVYSEGLFLLLCLLSFYFAKKETWVLAGLFGIIASATRVFGILLFPALLILAWEKRTPLLKFFWIVFIPLGLLAYMFYQWIFFQDPLLFYKLQKLVGEQHQSGITLLPQVYFRYFKILFSLNFNSPIFQTIILELLVGILFFILPIYGYFKKLSASFSFFALAGFLIPTLQGSFSSLPRYVLVFFPSFLALSIFLNQKPVWFRIFVLFFSIVSLIIETALFLRGYWIA